MHLNKLLNTPSNKQSNADGCLGTNCGLKVPMSGTLRTRTSIFLQRYNASLISPTLNRIMLLILWSVSICTTTRVHFSSCKHLKRMKLSINSTREDPPFTRIHAQFSLSLSVLPTRSCHSLIQPLMSWLSKCQICCHLCYCQLSSECKVAAALLLLTSRFSATLFITTFILHHYSKLHSPF